MAPPIRKTNGAVPNNVQSRDDQTALSRPTNGTAKAASQPAHDSSTWQAKWADLIGPQTRTVPRSVTCRAAAVGGAKEFAQADELRAVVDQYNAAFSKASANPNDLKSAQAHIAACSELTLAFAKAMPQHHEKLVEDFTQRGLKGEALTKAVAWVEAVIASRPTQVTS